MNAKWIVPTLVTGGLLVALAAIADDAAGRPAATAPEKLVRVAVKHAGAPDDARREASDHLGWLADGDDGAAGGGDRRIVIRERTGPGMGIGRGRGPRHGAGPGRGLRAHRGMGLGRLAMLDLTEAQRTKLAEIRERQQRKAIQSRADLQFAQLDLRKLMRAESPSVTAINAQIDRLSRLRADAQKGRVAAFLEARSVLTPEQRKQLREPGPGTPGGRRTTDSRGTGDGAPTPD